MRKVFLIDVSAPFEVWQHADPCNSGNLLSGVGPRSLRPPPEGKFTNFSEICFTKKLELEENPV